MYSGIENPSYGNRLNLDAAFYTAQYLAACNGDEEIKMYAAGDGSTYLYAEDAITGKASLPLYIGDKLARYNGEYILIDDLHKIFDINMTDIRLNKGMASKALALDANKKITYVDYDNFSHFKAGVDSTLYDIYNYNDATHYIGIDFVAGDGITLSESSSINKCLQISIASDIREYAYWTAKGYDGETAVTANVENNETVEFIGSDTVIVTPAVVSASITRFTFEATGFDKSIFARLTSDVSSSSTSAVNITGLSLALAANSVYEIEVSLNVGVSAEASGTAYGLSFSGAGTNTFYGNVCGVMTGTSVLSRYISALDNQYGSYCKYSNGNGGVVIKGIITTGSVAGNLTAQHVKLTSGTSYVYKGSFIKAIKR